MGRGKSVERRLFDDDITSAVPALQPAEGTDALPALPAAVRAYVHAATAPRTRQAYREDLARFLAWGGRIPSPPEVVAAYLAAHGESHAPSRAGGGGAAEMAAVIFVVAGDVKDRLLARPGAEGRQPVRLDAHVARQHQHVGVAGVSSRNGKNRLL